MQKILVALDLDDTASFKRLSSAAESLSEAESEIHYLCVVPDFGMSIVGSYFSEEHEQSVLQAAREQLQQMISGLDSQRLNKGHIAQGTVYDQIILTAKNLQCDVIVIGAHKPGLHNYLLGTNAARVARHATQSVFVSRD